jgi:hypothetical protein
MEKLKIIERELYRAFLVICFPIILSIWVFLLCEKGTRTKAFIFYWQSVLKKDLNLDCYKEEEL